MLLSQDPRGSQNQCVGIFASWIRIGRSRTLHWAIFFTTGDIGLCCRFIAELEYKCAPAGEEDKNVWYFPPRKICDFGFLCRGLSTLPWFLPVPSWSLWLQRRGSETGSRYSPTNPHKFNQISWRCVDDMWQQPTQRLHSKKARIQLTCFIWR